MKCSAILLISINISFLIISVLMITSGSTAQYIFGRYYYILENQHSISLFPSLWITTGCFLMIVSIFGILVTIGESILLINTYAVLLSMVVVLQVSSAIVGLMLGVCRSKDIVSETLNALMEAYDYDNSFRDAMDWMQSRYQCCGNLGPDDWSTHTFQFSSKNSVDAPETFNNASEILTSTSVPYNANSMPVSCCVRGSNYINLNCAKHYTNGCFASVQEVVASNILIASFLALALALFQLLSAVIAFMVTKTIRRERDIETDYSQLGMKSSYR